MTREEIKLEELMKEEEIITQIVEIMFILIVELMESIFSQHNV